MSRILLAYVATWQDFQLDALPVEKLTHLCYAFAKVVDGVVVAQEYKNHASGAAYCADVCRQMNGLKRRNPQLKVLISIGGWSADGFSDAALSADSRERFADSALAFMRDHQLDGLDLDWEYPSNDMAGIRARPEDKQNFTLLLQVLRQRLDAASIEDARDNRYLLAIAAGAGQYYLDGVELPAVAAQCDFINLMAYDFYNGWATRAGHHANLHSSALDADGDSAAKGVQLYLANGVAANKIVLGCPFYGRSLRGVGAAGLGAAGTPQSNGTYSYQQIATELITSGLYQEHWDEAAKAPWLFNGDEFISYENPASISLKGEYVKQHALAGAMFWEYSEDQTCDLLQALWLSLQDE